MGYISRDIAVIKEPEIITLSSVPNFVQFESKPDSKTYLEVNIQINITPDSPASNTLLRFVDMSGQPHEYRGVINEEDVNETVFYVSAEKSDTAENLRQVLLADIWFNSNYEVIIPFVWQNEKSNNGTVLNIKSKGAGKDFNISIEAYSDTAYTITWINRTSVNNDSICGESSTVEIDLDIYAGPYIFLGTDDRPISTSKIGTFVTTLKKTYAGSPLWFELNALFSKYDGYNRPSSTFGWFDTGTISAYRFTAKIKAVNSSNFYQSNALYVLRGYGPVSESPADMSPYVYKGDALKLLTNKPKTYYIRGQKEYLNFIFADPKRGTDHPEYFSLCIIYTAYSTSGRLLGSVLGQERNNADFAIVNTCLLDIDDILDQYPTTGIVRVALYKEESIISDCMEYTIRPESLHTLRQFSFINRLGGWDAYNFDAGINDEIKPSSETYNKSITPNYRNGGNGVETVYNTTLANTFTIEGAPVSDVVAKWLKELAEASVILDNDGTSIIIEDFTLQITDENKNMQRPIIKYRLSK